MNNKVCLVVPKTPPIGGMQVISKVYEKKLMKKNWLGCVLDKHGFAKKIYGSPDIPVSLRIWHFFSIPFGLIKNKSKYNIIHIMSCSYFGFIAFLVALPLKYLCRKKIVITYYGGDAHRFLSRFNFAKQALKIADEIIVPSKFLSTVFEKHGLKTNIIPDFSTMNHSTPNLRVKNELLSQKKVKILWVRHFENIYDPETALKIIEKLNKHVTIELNFVGSGPLEDKIRELASIGDVNIIFHKRIPFTDLQQLFLENHFYLNTSIIDNSPLTIKEALCNGCPVISTNAGGIPLMVGNNEGLRMFTIGDIDEAVDLFKHYIVSKYYCEIVSETENFKKKYSDLKIYEKLEKLYFN